MNNIIQYKLVRQKEKNQKLLLKAVSIFVFGLICTRSDSFIK